MKLRFYFGNDGVINKLTEQNTNDYSKIDSQTVDFFYISNTKDGIAPKTSAGVPQEIPQSSEKQIATKNFGKIPVYMHFQNRITNARDTDFVTNYHGVGTSMSIYDFLDFISIYRRELYKNPYNDKYYAESAWEPVLKLEDKLGSRFIYRDYDIANRRLYQYAIYLTKNSYKDLDRVEYAGYYDSIQTNWQGWSITELTPTMDPNVFEAHPKDVWRFNFNVSTGQHTQNMSKQQQDTLSTYVRVSNGPKNCMSGSVSCLLGKDVIQSEIADEQLPVYETTASHMNQTISFVDSGKTVNIGQYQQNLGRLTGDCGISYVSPNQVGFYNITSNPRIDMVNAWKDVCSSGNPKLLKDPAGQIFLVQITSSSMQFEDNIYNSPCTISFDWVQVGSSKGKVISEVSKYEFMKERGRDDGT